MAGLDNYIETMEQFCRDQGARAGLDFAEGFIQHLGFGHPADDILTDTLGHLCVPAGEVTDRD